MAETNSSTSSSSMANDVLGSMGGLSDSFSALMKKREELTAPYVEKAQKAEEAYAQAKGDIGIRKAELEAKSKRAGYAGEAAVYKKFEPELMAPPPTIQYSPETQESMSSLATLLPLAGMLMGGGGRLSGIGAMEAMSGVLEGHRQGNQDRIALETKNFEQKMNQWKLHIEQVKGAFERALKMASLNASGANAQLQVELAKLDAQMLKQDAARNGPVQASLKGIELADKFLNAADQSITKMYGTMAEVTQGAGPKAQLAKILDPRTAAATDDKSAATIVNAVRSAKKTYDLVAEGQDPDIDFGELGRIANQTQSFLERNLGTASIDSSQQSAAAATAAVDEAAKNAGLSPNDKNIVFFKKAIFNNLELEREARGGSILPVAVMRSLGPLLDPANLTKQQWTGIIMDRINTVAGVTGLEPDQFMQAMGRVPTFNLPTPTYKAPASAVPSGVSTSGW